jgi:glycine betaine transporter
MSDRRSLTQRVSSWSVDPVVFVGAGGLVLAFVIFGVLAPDALATASTDALAWVLRNFGWFFVLAAAAFLVLAIYLSTSRYGRLRLGRDDERPEFSTLSWVAMMFSAGMGIGLMFFGVAEPIAHYGAPPLGLAEAQTPDAAALSMQYTYFHWAFTPWAMYGMVGLAIGYTHMRKGRPELISAVFYPILGDRVYGPIGKGIDIVAIWATLFGSATSLGYGVAQINSGLNVLWDVSISEALQVAIIALLTVAFVVSAVTGVAKGIQFLSNVNMIIAGLIALFVLVFGPVVFISSHLIEGIGNYLFQLIPMSFRTGVSGGSEWLSGWTILYWAWWLSWTPFVGTFLARISRGRTIREYFIGVLLVPSGVSVVWFAIFGGAAIDIQESGAANLIDAASEVALYDLLDTYPIASFTSALVIFLVALFFVSGADAASVVMGTMSSRGSIAPKRAVVAIWGTLMGAAAAVLLLSGGLEGLQQATIILGLPFSAIMLLAVLCMVKELRTEHVPEPAPAAPRLAPTVTTGPAVPGEAGGGS